MTTPTISVTAVRFTGECDTVPRRIEMEGISYDLTSSYKKITFVSNEGTSSVFDVTDGTRRFRLKEELLQWQLLSVSLA